MKKLHEKYIIKAKPEEVWRALTDPSYIKGWGAGPANMDGNEGTEFKLWGGDIHGKNIKVVPFKRLAQEWYSKDWSKASKVEFIVHRSEDGTIVELKHTGIPEAEYGDIKHGWEHYYMGAIKEYLEEKIIS